MAPNRNARVSPALARAAIEAREAATKAAVEAKAAAAAAASAEEVQRARSEAVKAQEKVEVVERELAELEAVNDAEHKNYSTARMDANRLREAREKAEREKETSQATAQKLTAALDAAQAAFDDATAKKEAAEEFAVTKWDEAASAAERATASRENSEAVADTASEAARQASSAEGRRAACEARLMAADRERIEAESDAADLETKRTDALKVAEATSDPLNNKGGARAAWEKRQAEQSATALAEACEAAIAKVGKTKEATVRLTAQLQEAVEAEGPIKQQAAETETARLEAQAAAHTTELEAKNADAVARKAEQAARVARAAHQGAETKLGRELPAKEAADEAAAKAEEAEEAARTRSEAADQKETDCEQSASAAKAAAEVKQAERQTLTAEAKTKELLAADLESKEATWHEAEEHAAKLAIAAEDADARQYKLGEMLTETSSVAGMCECHGAGLSTAQAGHRTTFTIESRDVNGDRQPNGGDSFFVSIRYSGQGTRVRAQVQDLDDGSYTVAFKPESTGRVTIAVSLMGDPLQGSPYTCNVRPWRPMAPQKPCDAAAQLLRDARSVRRAQHATCEAHERSVLGSPQHAHVASASACSSDSLIIPPVLCPGAQVRAAQPCASQCDVRGAALSAVVAGSKESFVIAFHDELGSLAPACELDVCVLPAREEDVSTLFAARDEAAATAAKEAAAAENSRGSPGSVHAGTAQAAGPASTDTAATVIDGGWASSFGVDTFGGMEVDEALVVVTTPLDLTLTSELTSKWLGKVQPGRVLRVLRSEVPSHHRHLPVPRATTTCHRLVLHHHARPHRQAALPPASRRSWGGTAHVCSPRTTQAVGDQENGLLRAMVALEDAQSSKGDMSWRNTYAQKQDWRTRSWREMADDMERARDEAILVELAEKEAAAQRQKEAEQEAVRAKAEAEKVAARLARMSKEVAPAAAADEAPGTVAVADSEEAVKTGSAPETAPASAKSPAKAGGKGGGKGVKGGGASPEKKKKKGNKSEVRCLSSQISDGVCPSSPAFSSPSPNRLLAVSALSPL